MFHEVGGDLPMARSIKNIFPSILVVLKHFKTRQNVLPDLSCGVVFFVFFLATGPPQSDAGVGIGMLIGDRDYIARK